MMKVCANEMLPLQMYTTTKVNNYSWIKSYK